MNVNMEIVQEENKEICAKSKELIQLMHETQRIIEEKDIIQKTQKLIVENDNLRKLTDLSAEAHKLIEERNKFLKYPELIKEIQQITEIDDNFLIYTEIIKKAHSIFKEVQRLIELSDNPLVYTDVITNAQIWFEELMNHNPFSTVELIKETRRSIEETGNFLKLTESISETSRLIEEKKVNPNYIFSKLDELSAIINSIFIPKFEQLKKDVVEDIERLSDYITKTENVRSKRIKKIIEIHDKNFENFKKIIEKSDEEISYVDINKELEKLPNFPETKELKKIEFEKFFKMYSACSAMFSTYGVWRFWIIISESVIFLSFVAFSWFQNIFSDKLISIVIALLGTLVAYTLDKTLFSFLKNKLLYRVCNKIFAKISIIGFELLKLQYKDIVEEE